jgi:hypothetical protein
MLKEMTIRAAAIGISGGFLGPVLADWGLPWWLAEPVTGAASNNFGQAAVDVSNGRISSVRTYLWTSGEGAAGALVFGGLARGADRLLSGEPIPSGGVEETVVTEESSGGGTSRRDYANHGSDSFDDGARMVEQPYERSTPAVGEETQPEVQADDRIDAVEADGPGSAAHKAARWEEYQLRGGQWTYERWSNVYEANMERASAASQAALDFRDQLGWGKMEVTVDVEGVPRRLDIADRELQKAYEYKTGYQTATQSNLWEIERDSILQKQGWDIRWEFRDRASAQLRKALDDAGIPHN